MSGWRGSQCTVSQRPSGSESTSESRTSGNFGPFCFLSPAPPPPLSSSPDFPSPPSPSFDLSPALPPPPVPPKEPPSSFPPKISPRNLSQNLFFRIHELRNSLKKLDCRSSSTRCFSTDFSAILSANSFTLVQIHSSNASVLSVSTSFSRSFLTQSSLGSSKIGHEHSP